MKRRNSIGKKISINEIITIDAIPIEILLKIFTCIECKYSWETIRFIFNNIKMTCRTWSAIIESSEKLIYNALEIPLLHFTSAMNRDDEIVELYLDKNCPLRTPDKDGYSPACYATGNQAIKSMHRLESCYAFYIDSIPTIDLQIFAQNNLLTCSNTNYTISDFTNAIKQQSVKLLEEILQWDALNGNNIILSELFRHHMELIKNNIVDNNDINRLAMCIYKNFLVDSLWDMIGIPDIIIQECLKHDVNFNSCNEDGNTLLHIAVTNPEYFPMIKLLLSYNHININISNYQSDIPLSIAIHYQNTEAIKALSENKNVWYNEDCINGILMLDRDDYLKLAIQCGYKPVMSDLIVTLRINVKKYKGTKCLKILLDIFGANTRMPGGHTHIDFVISHNKVDLMNFLIQNGANININIKGLTLLDIAIKNNSKECLLILVKHLKNSIDKINPSTEYTPLTYASLLGHIDCLQILIRAGAQIDLKDGGGETALHRATSENHMDCIIALLNAKANINAQIDYPDENINGYTSLHYASYYGDVEIVKLLLERGADKTLSNTLGLTAKDIAVESSYLGDFNIIKILSENRADTTLPTRLGLEELDLDREEKYMHIFNLLQ